MLPSISGQHRGKCFAFCVEEWVNRGSPLGADDERVSDKNLAQRAPYGRDAPPKREVMRLCSFFSMSKDSVFKCSTASKVPKTESSRATEFIKRNSLILPWRVIIFTTGGLLKIYYSLA